MKDAQLRQTLVFAFGFMVTCLGLIVSGLRSTDLPDAAKDSSFKSGVDFLTIHPVPSLIGSAVLAWAIDLAFLRLSLQPSFLRGWIGGLSRFSEAVAASVMKRVPWALISYGVVILMLATILVVTFGMAIGLYWWTYHVLSPPL